MFAPGWLPRAALAGQEVDVHLPAAAGVGAIAEIDRLRRGDVVFAQFHVARLHPESVAMVRRLPAAAHRHPSVQLAAEEPHDPQPRKVQRLVEAEHRPRGRLEDDRAGDAVGAVVRAGGSVNDRAGIKPHPSVAQVLVVLHQEP